MTYDWYQRELDELKAKLAEARNAALEEAIAAVEASKPHRIKIDDGGWVEMTDDHGEVMGKMLQGETYRLNHKAGAVAAIRALITEEPK